MANINVLVEVAGVLGLDLSLGVDSSAVRVCHAVDEELDVAGFGLGDLEAIVRSIKRSSQSALRRVLNVTDPDRDTTGNFLVGAVDVDNASVRAWNPGSLVDFANVEAGVLELARLQVQKSPAGVTCGLGEVVLRDGQQGNRSISTGAERTAAGRTDQLPLRLSVRSADKWHNHILRSELGKAGSSQG